MVKKPTYEELEQRVKELEKEAVDRKLQGSESTKMQHTVLEILKVIPGTLNVVDKDYNILAVGGEITRKIEDTSRIIGEKCYKIFQERDTLCPWCKVGRVIETGEIVNETTTPDDPREKLIKKPLSIYVRPLKDKHGNIIGAIELGTDITQIRKAEDALQKAHDELEHRVKERTAELLKANQKLKVEIEERKRAEEELRESKEKYSTLVKNVLTGIYIDQDGKIVFANDRFGEIYGYPREECIGIESWKLVHADDRPLTNQMRARRLKGEHVPSEYEAMGLTKKGETIWIRRRNTNIEYGGKPAILGNVVDITEEKRAGEKLRKINKELKNFVDVVSHDLKTPIIAIQGFTSRLFKNNQEKLGEKGERHLELINASARRMEMLVSDLLALSSSGQVLSTFVNVSSLEIVENVSSGLRDKLKENRIELVVTEDLPPIYCDGERIYQVFENLLVNAIKYMGDTENPRIEIGFEDNGGFHQFYVRDNGVGIDAKYHQKVFEMFHRLREVEKEEGTGLGLAIVERIVNTHGGRVWVESEKGKGATFYFTLLKRES